MRVPVAVRAMAQGESGSRGGAGVTSEDGLAGLALPNSARYRRMGRGGGEVKGQADTDETAARSGGNSIAPKAKGSGPNFVK